MDNNFSKSDLRSGMVVETRGEGNWLVVNNTLINGDGWLNLDKYDEDLIKIGNSWGSIDRQFDIMKVFKIQEGWNCTTDGIKNPEDLIWKREEIKEMTIEEIQKELGYKIKIVEKEEPSYRRF